MIPVPMTPYHSFDIRTIHTVFLQLFAHALLNLDTPATAFDALFYNRREVLWVGADAEVEEQLAAGGVLD